MDKMFFSYRDMVSSFSADVGFEKNNSNVTPDTEIPFLITWREPF